MNKTMAIKPKKRRIDVTRRLWEAEPNRLKKIPQRKKTRLA